MSARAEAARCLAEGRTVKRGPAAVEHARDLAASVGARAVLRHDWEAALVYAVAYGLLATRVERTWKARDERRRSAA